jgi:hypothetical protein
MYQQLIDNRKNFRTGYFRALWVMAPGSMNLRHLNLIG